MQDRPIFVSIDVVTSFHNQLVSQFGVTGIILAVGTDNIATVKYAGTCGDLDLPYLEVEFPNSFRYVIPPSSYTTQISDTECLFLV